HYMADPEMVAVTGYDPHPITRSVSLTFYPGVRPLSLVKPSGEIRATPLLMSSRDSYTRDVEAVASRVPGGAPADTLALASSSTATTPPVGPRVLGIAAEGVLAGATNPLRAVLIGDGDFASNS